MIDLYLATPTGPVLEFDGNTSDEEIAEFLVGTGLALSQTESVRTESGRYRAPLVTVPRGWDFV